MSCWHSHTLCIVGHDLCVSGYVSAHTCFGLELRRVRVSPTITAKVRQHHMFIRQWATWMGYQAGCRGPMASQKPRIPSITLDMLSDLSTLGRHVYIQFEGQMSDIIPDTASGA